MSNSNQEQIESYFQLQQNALKLQITLDLFAYNQEYILNCISIQIQSLNTIVDLSIIITQSCILENMEFLEKGLSRLKTIKTLSFEFEQQCNVNKDGILNLTRSITQIDQILNLRLCFQDQNILDLQSINHINDCIKCLPNLKKLSLQMQQFNQLSNSILETFSEGLSHITSLQDLSLNLDFSSVKQSGVEVFSNTLQLLTNLIQLEIIFNNNYDIRIDQISNSIGKLVKLKKFAFQSQQLLILQQQDIESLTNCLENLIELEEISLQGLISPSQQQYHLMVIKSLSNSVKLKNITLDFENFNMINSDDALIVGQVLSKFNRLNSLNIKLYDSTSYKDQFIKQIAACLQNMTQLTSFNLDCQSWVIKCDSDYLFEQIRFLKNLQILYFNFNEQFFIKQEEINLLGKSIEILKELKNLNLNLHRVSFQLNLGNIYQAISKLSNLEQLTYQFSQKPTNRDLQQFSESIQHLNKLTHLNVKSGFVDIKDEVLSSFSLALSQLQDLIELKFNLSGLTDISIQGQKTFFKALSQLNNLQNLRLDIEFRLTTDSSKHFGDCLVQLKNLKIFSFNTKSETPYKLTHLYNIMQGLQSMDLQTIKFSVFYFDDSQQIDQEMDIFGSIKSLQNLQFKIAKTKFDSDYYKILFNSLKNIKTITNLKVDIGPSLKLTYDGLIALRNFFLNSPNLLILSLALGKVQGQKSEEGLELFFEGIQSLKRVKNILIQFQDKYECFLQIIDSIQQLSNLRQASIFFNSQQGQLIQAKAPTLINQFQQQQENFPKFLTSLTLFLSLPDNQQKQILIDALRNIRYLKFLNYFYVSSFQKHKLRNKEIKELGLSLQQIRNIHFLHLNFFSKSNLKKVSVLELAKGLVNQKQLAEFTLHASENIQIDYEGVNSIMESFQYLKNLQNLSLQLSQKDTISNESLIKLGESLSSLQEIRVLNLNLSINLSILDKINLEVGVQSISNCFKYIIKLTTLNLNFSDYFILGQQAGISLGKGIRSLINLQNLDLRIGLDSQISNEGGVEIAKSLSQLRNLSILNINIDQKNGLTADIMHQFSLSIQTLGYLRTVSIQLAATQHLQLPPFLVDQLLNSNKEELCKLILNEYEERYSYMFYYQSDQLDLILTLIVNDRQLLPIDIQLLLQGFVNLPTNYNIAFIFENNFPINQETLEELALQLPNLSTKNIELNFYNSTELNECIVDIFKGISKMPQIRDFNFQLNYNQSINNQFLESIQYINQSNQIFSLNILLIENQTIQFLEYEGVIKELCKMKNLKVLKFTVENTTIAKAFTNKFYRLISKLIPRLVCLEIYS